MFSDEFRWSLRPIPVLVLMVMAVFVLDSSGIVSADAAFPVVIFLFVILLLGWMYAGVHSFRPPYGVRSLSYTGGVFMGGSIWFGTHASWPMAKLVVMDNELVVVAPWKKYSFNRSEVEVGFGGILGTSLTFVHHRPDYPKIIRFAVGSPPSKSGMKDAIKGMGYRIRE